LIACPFDGERELNLGPKDRRNVFDQFNVLHLFACDQGLHCFSKSPSPHKAYNNFFGNQLLASLFNLLQIVLFSHGVCFFGQLSNLFVGKFAVFGAQLLVGKASNLHDPVNELPELSASNETLNYFDASQKFILFNSVLPVNLLNCLSDLRVNLFQSACPYFPLLKFVQKHSRLDQLSEFPAPDERLNDLDGFPSL